VLGGVGGLKGVLRIRYGSGGAEKWTSVSPCLVVEQRLQRVHLAVAAQVQSESRS